MRGQHIPDQLMRDLLFPRREEQPVFEHVLEIPVAFDKLGSLRFETPSAILQRTAGDDLISSRLNLTAVTTTVENSVPGKSSLILVRLVSK